MRTLLVPLLLALALAPAGSAATPSVSTPTTLYFHIFDTFNAFPVNTQPPDTQYFKVGGTNFPTIASQGYDFNTIYGFATPGPVEYNFIENGQPRFHRERGIAADVILDKAVQPVAHLYLDVRDVRGGDTAPNYLPSFTFRVAMQEGNQVGNDADLDGKPVLMSGQLTLDVWDGQGANGLNAPLGGQTNPLTGNTIAVPDADGIVEFAIPMTLAAERIPKAEAYHMRIDWYQNPSKDASQDDAMAEGYMRLAMDATHLPRLTLAVMNPVYIEYVHPEVAAGILLIHTAVNSPWGTYDVDIANMTVQIDGPVQPQSLQQVVSQNTHVHNLHDKAAEVTYLWRFRDEAAPNGKYAIHVDIPNLAGTAHASEDAQFTIEGKKAYGVSDKGDIVEPVVSTGTQKSPAPAAAMVGLAVAFALRRRA